MVTICETAASLRVMGDTLDPDEVTRMLAGDPDITRCKGVTFQTPKGKQVTSRTGIWRKTAERKCPGDLDIQVVEILEQLTDDLDMWAHLSQHYDVEFFCGLIMKESNEGLRLRSETIEMLAAHQISLDFDIYSTEPVKNDELQAKFNRE
ncbi:DUF4279 domain-containing protein [Parasedimentitalea huanghaiensis]|uniref:DUF4279 domain-containing protein n=1 Tax=Parasedimentitalea huanghaiensis TaxID=2682100 RepID=A0A6L6WNV2_9RHOB|nr:DUF4279 domain-containing protein [Zongyanglinia huanghaiensis]MVO18345.1 DUF4279 domain-containing protein [Zongyanglinia huanghaiensis]